MCSFFFNNPATTEFYPLPLHDALPICVCRGATPPVVHDSCSPGDLNCDGLSGSRSRDRKSTRLNSSHDQISYAVFCLKKKNNSIHPYTACTRCQHSHPRPYVPSTSHTS